MSIILLGIDLVILLGFSFFTYESIKEKEPRAPKWGFAGIGVALVLAGFIMVFPAWRAAIGVFFSTIALFCIIFLIPWKGNPSAGNGSLGYVVGEVKRFDERDIVFARNRSLPPDPEMVRRYYVSHPDWEKQDADRRQKGGPLGRIGLIDKGYEPNVAMVKAAFAFPQMIGKETRMTPPSEENPYSVDPDRASEIVKGLAKHLGACLVGICPLNPNWVYAHRGEIYYDNWEEWGKEIEPPEPYAVIIATEMDHAQVGAGPHTPTLVESSTNYAKGAFITTILASYFAGLGYKASAHHNRHYDLLLVPLAIDAGLGELGRHGYLVAKSFGPRVRLFAVTTDMALAPDNPIDLGVETFCRHCKKCAHSCPSRSIPQGDRTVKNGLKRWTINAESCFDYWGKIGTDCSVCMGVCPFSRPDRSLHRLVRWILARSFFAQRVFPLIDNLVYGERWKPRPVASWVDFGKQSE